MLQLNDATPQKYEHLTSMSMNEDSMCFRFVFMTFFHQTAEVGEKPSLRPWAKLKYHTWIRYKGGDWFTQSIFQWEEKKYERWEQKRKHDWEAIECKRFGKGWCSGPFSAKGMIFRLRVGPLRRLAARQNMGLKLQKQKFRARILVVSNIFHFGPCNMIPIDLPHFAHVSARLITRAAKMTTYPF